MHPQIISDAMMKTFELGNDGEHGQGGFDGHPLVALPFGAQDEIGRNAVLVAEAQVSQGMV